MRVVLPPEQVADLPVVRLADKHGMPCDKSARTAAQMMKINLRITNTALAEIERIFVSSGLDRKSHTPALLKSHTIEVPPGYSKPEVLRSVDSRRLKSVIGQLVPRKNANGPYEWVVGLYETKRLDSRDVFSVEGIDLALLPGTLSEVDGCILDYQDRWVLTRG
jgi:hypothetical protein